MKTKRAGKEATAGLAAIQGRKSCISIRGRRGSPANGSPSLKSRVHKLISKMNATKRGGFAMETTIRDRLKQSGFPTTASTIRTALERCVKAGLLKKLRDDVFSIPAKTGQSSGLPRGRRPKGFPAIEGQRRQPKATDSRSSAASKRRLLPGSDAEKDKLTTDSQPIRTKPETSTLMPRWGSVM